MNQLKTQQHAVFNGTEAVRWFVPIGLAVIAIVAIHISLGVGGYPDTESHRNIDFTVWGLIHLVTAEIIVLCAIGSLYFFNDTVKEMVGNKQIKALWTYPAMSVTAHMLLAFWSQSPEAQPLWATLHSFPIILGWTIVHLAEEQLADKPRNIRRLKYSATYHVVLTILACMAYWVLNQGFTTRVNGGDTAITFVWIVCVGYLAARTFVMTAYPDTFTSTKRDNTRVLNNVSILLAFIVFIAAASWTTSFIWMYVTAAGTVLYCAFSYEVQPSTQQIAEEAGHDA